MTTRTLAARFPELEDDEELNGGDAVQVLGEWYEELKAAEASTRNAKYRDAAKRWKHEEGVLEIDDLAEVSELVAEADDPDDEGAYVAAWVWISDEEANR